MDTALIITLVFSVVTAFLVIVEIVINFYNHRKERNIQAVTEQRAQWIQNLRQVFGETIDLLDLAIDNLIRLERGSLGRRNFSDKNIAVSTYELRSKYTQLRLLLNFNNTADITILNTLSDLICRLDYEFDYCHMIDFPDYYVNEYTAAKELAVLYMNIYLKAEWERLKKESKTGSTSSKYFDDTYKRIIENNKAKIEKLSKIAYRLTLEDFVKYLEGFEEFKEINVKPYNCLNLCDFDN